MDTKWFFVIVGAMFTFSILLGIFFVGSFVIKQSEINSNIQILRIDNNYVKLLNELQLQYLRELNNQEYIITEVKDNLDKYSNQVNTTVNDIKSMLLSINSTIS